MVVSSGWDRGGRTDGRAGHPTADVGTRRITDPAPTYLVDPVGEGTALVRRHRVCPLSCLSHCVHVSLRCCCSLPSVGLAAACVRGLLSALTVRLKTRAAAAGLPAHGRRGCSVLGMGCVILSGSEHGHAGLLVLGYALARSRRLTSVVLARPDRSDRGVVGLLECIRTKGFGGGAPRQQLL